MASARFPAFVVGHDFSAGAAAALALGVAWARARGATLEVVHAAAEGLDIAATAELSARLRELADEAGAGAGADGLQARPGASVAVARPALLVREIARRVDACMVIGCEGSSATLLRLGGSVAVELARDPATPLLVAPPRWKPRPERERPLVARILAGLSRSEGDVLVMAEALALARETAADLAFAHSVDVSHARDMPKLAREQVLRRGQEEAAEAVRELREIVADVVPIEEWTRGEVPVHVTCQGPPWRDLAGLAVSQDADLLVVGRGDLAARMVAVTPCPLLVLP